MLAIVALNTPSQQYVDDIIKLVTIPGESYPNASALRATMASPDVISFGACDGQHVYGYAEVAIRRHGHWSMDGFVTEFRLSFDSRHPTVAPALLAGMLAGCEAKGLKNLICYIPTPVGVLVELFTAHGFVAEDATTYVCRLKS